MARRGAANGKKNGGGDGTSKDPLRKTKKQPPKPRAGAATNLYAVRRGRSTGVFSTWEECRAQVNRFDGAQFKKFATMDEANDFVAGGEAFRLSGYAAAASSSTSATGGDSQTNKEQAKEEPLPDGWEEVYTDGCCLMNGQKGAYGGIGVWWGDGDARNLSEALRGVQTNNRAEIEAAIRAIQQAKTIGLRGVRVKTDSQFMINAMTKWVMGWRRNGWQTADGSSVKNRVDFERLIDAATGIQVKWVHVRGHRGIHGNEQADRLANDGARMP